MATLKLVWIKCEGLAVGQSLTLTPFFSNAPVSSPSGPAIVTLTDSNQVLFHPETKVNFFRMDDFIYLYTSDEAIFSSKILIWDTKTVSQETPFGIMVDPTGLYSDLQLTVYYNLEASVVASSMH